MKKRTTGRLLVGLVAVLLAAFGLAAVPAAAEIPDDGTTERASADAGVSGGRELPAVSANGRFVVFVGRGEAQGVWLKDRQLDTTRQLTTGSHFNPDISPDGRYVVYVVYGANRSVRMIDLETNEDILVSLRDNGDPATGLSDFPAVSEGGRFIAFQSTDSEIDDTTGPAGGGPNKVYVHDRTAGTTKMVSVTNSGQAAKGNAIKADITADGRYVVFASDADNLATLTDLAAEEEETTVQHVYLRDTETERTLLISLSSDEVSGDAISAGEFGPTISDDGRYVAFESEASNLVPGDTNLDRDAFVRDLVAGTTRRVSLAGASQADLDNDAADPCPDVGDDPDAVLPTPVVGGGPVISRDGTRVAFQSLAALTADDVNGVLDIYAMDLGDGDVARVSIPVAGGTEATGCRTDGHTGLSVPTNNGVDPAINGNGRYVAFVGNGDLADDRMIDLAEEEEDSGEPAVFVRVLGFPPSPLGLDPELMGYQIVRSDGDVSAAGDAMTYGDMAGVPLNKPVVGMASTPTGEGYWLAATDGGIFSFGDAQFFGSTGGIVLNQPVVGMAATPSGAGYWFVASDGGVFAYGDAGFQGSLGGLALNEPVVGMAPTPSGAGYWLVASDGGVFAFGDAQFWGSTGGIELNQPIVGMAPTPSGAGYWLVASDGGVFAFGDAGFHGSGASTVGATVSGIAASPTGLGYWILREDGAVAGFGDAQAHGDLPDTGVAAVAIIGR